MNDGTTPDRRQRRGVTLIELLIVVAILMLLAGIALPMMRPAIESRRLREAARSVHTYLNAARIRAIETGRPYGVLIQRDSTMPTAGTTMQLVALPPPYAGDSTNCRVTICWTGTIIHDEAKALDVELGASSATSLGGNAYYLPGPYTYKGYSPTTELHLGNNPNFPRNAPPVLDAPYPMQVVIEIYYQAGYFRTGMFRPWDWIQFEGAGPWYQILPNGQSGLQTQTTVDTKTGYVIFGNGNVSSMRAVAGIPPKGTLGWADVDTQTANKNWSHPMTFQIIRQPQPLATTTERRVLVGRSSAAPLALPKQVAIDLGASGTDSAPTLFAPSALELAGTIDPDYQASPVILVYLPNGSLERICWQGTMSRVTEPVFLLIGERSRTVVPLPDPSSAPPDGWTPPVDQLPNWVDPSNLWVSVHPQTGKAKVSPGARPPIPYDGREVASPKQGEAGIGTGPSFDWSKRSTWSYHVRGTRKFAYQNEGKGGL